MASLTTVYVLSLILASMAGMGSGWYGNSLNEKPGVSEPVVEEPPVEVPVEAPVEPPPTDQETATQESNTEQTESPTSSEASQRPEA